MSSNPVPIDFDSLWTQLGVTPSGNTTVTFNPKAPLAEIREAIFSPPDEASKKKGPNSP